MRPACRATTIITLFALGLALTGCTGAAPATGTSATQIASATQTTATPRTTATTQITPVAQTTAHPSGEEFPGTIILGRPTATTATLSLLSRSDVTFWVEYGPASGTYPQRTAEYEAAAGEPAEVSLTGLRPDGACFYQVVFTAPGQTAAGRTSEYSFHTQRAAGTSFTFAVEADPHIDIDGKMQPELFRQALAGIAAASPDFLIDLGDTFLGDKFARDYATLDSQYAADRAYFGMVGPSLPLFLVNGNHEGESGWALDGTADNLAVWATTARKKYYPNPFPDGFYTGDASEQPFVGQRESYYAWEWGDALFVVIDPYYWTTRNPKQSNDLWDYTLGIEQYQWLEQTLETSSARFKFVFSHHILGDVRGGIEWAGLYEWGGADKNGTFMFPDMRPGWGLPIHRLFVENGVDIFFQGHDHFFVRQELDGIVYQEVPQPATRGGDAQNIAHEYAYKSGTVLASPGYLLVEVSASKVQVEYLQLAGAADSGVTGKRGVTRPTTETAPAPGTWGVAFSYEVE